MTTEIDKTADPSAEQLNTKKEKSSKFSKAKSLATAGLTAAMMTGMTINADAQIHDLGVTPDGRFSVLLTDMGQERVYWDGTGPNRQGMGIYYIDQDTGEEVWVFMSDNNEIYINEVNGEIINTTVDGRQARKWVFDPLPEGVEYIIKSDLVTSDLQYPVGDNTYMTWISTETESANVKVNDIMTTVWDTSDPNITKQLWGNRLGADEEGIELVPAGNGTTITIPIPVMRDESEDTSLDASDRQTGALVGVRSSTGQEEILSGEDILRGENSISVTTTFTDIKEIWYQHPALGTTVLDYMNTAEQSAIKPEISIAPNPITTGQMLKIQTPNGMKIKGYEIFDLSGRKISGGKRQPDTDITSFLPQGQYILRLQGDQWSSSHKIIKQ